MNNPFSPPTAEVADIERNPREASWARTTLLIAVFGALSLATSWLVVPVLAEGLARRFGIASANATPAFLAVDLALTSLAFCVGCSFAAKLSLGVKTRLFVYGALEQMRLGDLPSLKGLHG